MRTPPVLVLAWRRPDLATRLLRSVAAAQPERIFLACDGWAADSPSGLVASVRATREALEAGVTWPCTVERRYADRNLGVRVAVESAIDWFFSHCDEGIILEDDCHPHPDFFPYCAELLSRYRDDERVMCVSGDNSSGARIPAGQSYAFGRWPSPWGWATWRRAWARYDRDLDATAALDDDAWTQRVPDPDERRVWQERLWALRRTGTPNTWDLRWILSMITANGCSVVPSVNLIDNTGFGAGATNTVSAPAWEMVTADAILPLEHPTTTEVDSAVSSSIFDTVLGGASERARFRWERTLRGRIRTVLSRHLFGRIPSVIRPRGRVATPPWSPRRP